MSFYFNGRMKITGAARSL